MSVVIRTADPDQMSLRLRQLLDREAPNSPRIVINTGRDLIAADLGRERLGAWLFSGFGFVALALGIGGVFGLVAYLAESRRREFGIRLALGATSADLRRLAMTAGLWPSAAGAIGGLVGAAWISRMASSLLVGISRLDPLSYAAAAALVVASAGLSAWIAAQRLRRLQPVDALRAE